MPINLTIIDPSGQPDREALERNRSALEHVGFSPVWRAFPSSAGHRLYAKGVRSRAQLLTEALHEFDIIVCARGGYGMSDLLDHLDFEDLETLAPRLVVGFSDISALHSALYARLGWHSLHGPMPGSSLWQCDGKDVAALCNIMNMWPGACQGEISVKGWAGRDELRGTLFGGCLSVLGALVGTAYFPKTLDRHIVFIEDVNETVPRILRHWNQWLQSGVLDGAVAVVLGHFTHDDDHEQARLEALPALIQERTPCPVLWSESFGHICPNRPLMIGAKAVVSEHSVRWHFSPGELIA